MRNVFKAKLVSEGSVFLTSEDFGEAVSRHLLSRDLLDFNFMALYSLAYPHLIDINVAELSLKTFCRLSNYTNCLGVVAVYC